MAKIRTIQIYRGTTAQNDAYTGSAGELTMDTTTNKLRLHDGSTAGGHVVNGTHPDLFDHKWADHILNDISWLRADTFSWQDGGVYEAAYNHLASDLGTVAPLYAWKGNSLTKYTTSANPELSDILYIQNNGFFSEPVIGKSILTVGTDYIIDNLGQAFTRSSEDDIVSGIILLLTPQTETISGTTIEYYLADDGHKICTSDQESNVVSIYNATGVAWYYIIDTVNQRFKLPRTKFGFTGLRDTVGKYVAPGLPNISGKTGLSLGGSSTDYLSGPFYVDTNGSSITGSSSSSSYRNIKFNAALSSSIYGNSTTVQAPATQQYLYFYVGNFTQTALENTAGLNASLFNNKVDLDAQNLSSAGKAQVAHLSMPSNTRTVLTLGASGTSYTAPATGYVTLRKLSSGSGQTIRIFGRGSMAISVISSGSGHNLETFMPVSKGDSFRVYYTAGGTTEDFAFISAYCES